MVEWFGLVATWRLTELLYDEEGPWGILVILRSFLRQIGMERLLGCYYCLSVWVGAVVALYQVAVCGLGWASFPILALANSGAAIVLARLVDYWEDQRGL